MIETASTNPKEAELWMRIQNESNQIIEKLIEIIKASKPQIDIKQSSDNQAELLKTQKDYQDAVKAIQKLEKDIALHVIEKEGLKHEFEEEKLELQNHIASLEEENRKYLDMIIKHSKGISAQGSVASPTTKKKDTSVDTPKEKKVLNISNKI